MLSGVKGQHGQHRRIIFRHRPLKSPINKKASRLHDFSWKCAGLKLFWTFSRSEERFVSLRFGLTLQWKPSQRWGEAGYEATNITWRSAVKQVLLQSTPQF